ESAWLYFGDTTWADYDLEVEVQKVRGFDGGGVGVRMTGPENSYLFNLGGWGNQKQAVECEGDGQRFTLAPARAGGLQTGRWHRVRIEVRGDHLRGLLDDEVILDLRDNHHARGQVGLRSWNNVNRFRNIKVTDPDGRVLWEGLPWLETPEQAQLSDR